MFRIQKLGIFIQYFMNGLKGQSLTNFKSRRGEGWAVLILVKETFFSINLGMVVK